ncbi:hypothetical protein [Streptomyces longispororuber]|uniref:hypothetical protein n=1 Tax=Streptomyces longispororuber TaxID=68230 RepID=UPI0035AC0AFB
MRTRTHRSELNTPYIQRGWNGKQIDDVLSGRWSLKCRATSKSVQYRSIPCTVPFRPGRRDHRHLADRRRRAGDTAAARGR